MICLRPTFLFSTLRNFNSAYVLSMILISITAPQEEFVNITWYIIDNKKIHKKTTYIHTECFWSSQNPKSKIVIKSVSKFTHKIMIKSSQKLRVQFFFYRLLYDTARNQWIRNRPQLISERNGLSRLLVETVLFIANYEINHGWIHELVYKRSATSEQRSRPLLQLHTLWWLLHLLWSLRFLNECMGFGDFFRYV